MPPLRQRREEIPHLATYFLREASEKLSKPDISLGPDVLDLFAQYWWPGNVRQLRNELQRSVAMAPPGGTIGPEHLSADLTAAAPNTGGPTQPRVALRGGQTLASVVDEIERDLIREMMSRHRGKSSESARDRVLDRRGFT